MDDKLDINNIHKVLPKDFVVFAGTGATYGTGLPESWEVLLERLQKKKPVKGIKLESLDGCNYPSYAEMYFNGCNLHHLPSGFPANPAIQ